MTFPYWFDLNLNEASCFRLLQECDVLDIIPTGLIRNADAFVGRYVLHFLSFDIVLTKTCLWDHYQT